MSEQFEYTDRYKATGTPYPDPATMCKGPCEGMGFFPIHKDDIRFASKDEPWHSLWLQAEAKTHSEDGWHLVRCPDCGGTGKKS